MASGIIRKDNHGITVSGWYIQPSKNLGQFAKWPTYRFTWDLEVLGGQLSFIKMRWCRERLLCKEPRKSGLIYTKMRTFYNIRDNRNVENFVISNWAFLYNPDICQWLQWGNARIWRNGDVSLHHRKFGQRQIDIKVGTWKTEEKKRTYRTSNPKFLPARISSRSIRHLVYEQDKDLDIKEFGKQNGVKLRQPTEDMAEFNKKFYNGNREYIEKWKT